MKENMGWSGQYIDIVGAGEGREEEVRDVGMCIKRQRWKWEEIYKARSNDSQNIFFPIVIGIRSCSSLLFIHVCSHTSITPSPSARGTRSLAMAIEAK